MGGVTAIELKWGIQSIRSATYCLCVYAAGEFDLIRSSPCLFVGMLRLEQNARIKLCHISFVPQVITGLYVGGLTGNFFLFLRMMTFG